MVVRLVAAIGVPAETLKRWAPRALHDASTARARSCRLAGGGARHRARASRTPGAQAGPALGRLPGIPCAARSRQPRDQSDPLWPGTRVPCSISLHLTACVQDTGHSRSNWRPRFGHLALSRHQPISVAIVHRVEELMRRIAALGFLAIWILGGCGGDGESEAERIVEPCEQLRDHLVDLRVEGTRGTPDEVAQHRAAVRQALGEGFVASCEQRMAKDEVECASKASDFAAVTACSPSTSSASSPTQPDSTAAHRSKL